MTIERRVKVQTQNGPMDRSHVLVRETTEKWCEVYLEDGTVLCV